MSNDFNINHADLQLVEAEARRLRAEALRAGIRSLKTWGGKIVHRGSEPTAL
jgi:hypothetical protein